MPVVKRHGVSGRDHYESIYQTELDIEADWLQRGAPDKVDSIQQLLQKNSITPSTILELGCGTGAVIQEIKRRRLGQEYMGIDYSQEAIDYLRDHSEGIEVRVADLTQEDFTLNGAFDLVVLSHVLEHFEEPHSFLASITSKLDFTYLIAEVPLEDLPVVRFKSRGKDRTRNKAGHVQFFTASSFEELLLSNNLEIIDSRRYVPIPSPDTIAFWVEKNEMPDRERIKRLLARYVKIAFRGLWSRLYYAHYACLCRVKSS